MTWAADKLSAYVLGKDFTMETDHKPLVTLMTNTDLAKVPPRILRFRLRLMRFAPVVRYVPGKENLTADGLSRAPVGKPGRNDTLLVDEVEDFADSIVRSLPASSPRLAEIKNAQQADEVLRQVIHYVQHGWPAYIPQDPLLRPYWVVRERLSLHDQLLIYAALIVL